MTELLDLAALKDFESGATPSAHVAGDFHVTTAKLGVYRPEEHIDNPQGMLDGSAVDPLFHGPVLPAEIAIDPTTGLKAYIATRGGGFRTAADFVEESLRRALAAGKGPEGYRLFGQGFAIGAHLTRERIAATRNRRDIHTATSSGGRMLRNARQSSTS